MLNRSAAAGFVFWIALAIAAFAYAQGLGGHFIFDDSWNLRGLETIARNPSLETMRGYIVDGFASDIGRPLALATFAPQFNSFPGHPGDFIAVNIALHLLNACLLCWLLVRLCALVPGAPAGAAPLAVTIAVLWMVAPLQASAVLYIIQRMALLAATLVFGGLLIYLVGRARLTTRPVLGAALMALGIGVGSGLGVLAKETAALLPLLVLVLELTLGRSWPRNRLWTVCVGVLLVAPTLLILGYMASRYGAWQEASLERGFSLGERMLTEARVLFVYLHKLMLPSLFSIRLLYDDLAVSRSLLVPWTTLPSVVAWLGLTAAAVLLRARAPVFAFATLWFLAAHLLEATIIPLEIAFEHRNYVAAIGPLFALVWYGFRLARSARVPRMRLIVPLAAVLYLGFQVVALWHSARLWGRPFLLAMYWAETQPQSKRAQFQKADTLIALRYPDKALDVYEASIARWPDDPALPIAMMEIGCYYPDSRKPPPAETVRSALERFNGQVHQTLNMMDRIIRSIEDKICQRYDLEELDRIAAWIAGAPAFQKHQRNTLLMQSRIAELRGDRGRAMAALVGAIDLRATMPLIVQAVIWSVEEREFETAWRYVRMAEEDGAVPAVDRWGYRETIVKLRELVAHYENEAR